MPLGSIGPGDPMIPVVTPSQRPTIQRKIVAIDMRPSRRPTGTLSSIKLEIQSIIVMIHRPAPRPVQKSATTDLPSPCHPSKSSRHLISPVYHSFVWASVHSSTKTRPARGAHEGAPSKGLVQWIYAMNWMTQHMFPTVATNRNQGK